RIGRELALRFAERNIPVWVGARDLAEAERIAADVRVRTGVTAIAGTFDARDADAMPALVERIERELGPLTNA
ncbi:MAG TPA: SDR family NAD(P)-dependent oxidoreductase, partial [Myxococcota bacterium]|nr:SDR family NAD(P)-dependent oxidoreductase [Myxococcota bacterium]